MHLNLLQGRRVDRAGEHVTSSGGAAPHFGLEPLEGRVLMSVAPALPHNLGAAGAGTNLNLNAVTQALRKSAVDVSRLASMSVQDLTRNLKLAADNSGNLVGTTTALLRLPGGFTQGVPVKVTLEPAGGHAMAGDGVTAQQTDIDCPILNLELGPIDLNVLGLRVQTSEICLRIGANEGPGNLLGNLLCGVTGLLDDLNLDLGAITRVINRILPLDLGLNLNGFTSQGGNLLALAGLSLTGGGATATQALRLPFAPTLDADSCAILNLDVGPLDLNLLGLVVQLDDCDGGPVTIDITGERGPGNLLGNLLCGITGALDDGLPLDRLARQLNRLIDRIDRFFDRLDRLLDRFDR